MPLRSCRGISCRHSGFCFSRMEHILGSYASKPTCFRSVENFGSRKLRTWPFIKARSSRGLDLSSQPKDGLLIYFSCPLEREDRISGGEMGKRGLWAVGSNDVAHIHKSIASFEPLPSQSFRPSEFARAAMLGRKVSTAKTQEWRQLWSHGRRNHMGDAHGYDDHESREKLGAYGEKILRWGLWSDIVLTVCKIAAGCVSGSTAIIADAAHSASDIGLSGVALWCSKASKAPPDQEHPYGYGKVETVGALSISALLLVTGGGIAWSAVDALQALAPAMSATQDAITQATVDIAARQEIHNHGRNEEHGFMAHKHALDMEHMEVALLVAIVCIGAKEGELRKVHEYLNGLLEGREYKKMMSLYWITKAAGEKSGSALLKANAWHHRGDAVSTLVALIGVGGAMMSMPLLDPVAALLVSGMIMKAGLEYGHQSMQELLDRGLPQSILVPIRRTVLQVDGVEDIRQLRGRRMGSIVEIDVHMEVDPSLSVSAAHTIGETLRQQVRSHHPNVSEIFVHIDSADGRPSLSAPIGTDEQKQSHDHGGHSHRNRHSRGDHHVEHSCEPKHLHERDDPQHPDSHDQDHGHKHHQNRRSQDQNHDQGKSVDGEVRGEDERASLNRVGQKVVSEIQGKFGVVVKVRSLTCQFSQGKVVAEVGVSMDPNLSIRDAMRHASEAEIWLVQNVEGLAAISLQLNLSS